MVSESTLCKCPYEVGDVLTTRNAADPATRWPGTSWQRITDRFILGAGGSYSVGATGGEASHTLTVNEMPSHNHPSGVSSTSALSGTSGSTTAQCFFDRNYGYTAYTGGSAAHNNMPPYIALYFWERTA